MTLPPIGRFEIRLRRNRSFWLRNPMVVEKHMLHALALLIRPGDVVYDIGANIGLYTRFFAGPFRAGHVIAFEPMRENVDLLKANAALASPTDCLIEIVDVAVTDEDGSADLQVDDVMSATAVLDSVAIGAAALGRRKFGLPPLTERVTTVRLDTWCASRRMAAPSVIKIDVEGAEELVLAGATQTLLRYAPRLVIEVHGIKHVCGVCDSLENAGYHCYRLRNGAARDSYERITVADARRLTDQYDVQFLVASKNHADIASLVA